MFILSGDSLKSLYFFSENDQPLLWMRGSALGKITIMIQSITNLLKKMTDSKKTVLETEVIEEEEERSIFPYFDEIKPPWFRATSADKIYLLKKKDTRRDSVLKLKRKRGKRFHIKNMKISKKKEADRLMCYQEKAICLKTFYMTVFSLRRLRSGTFCSMANTNQNLNLCQKVIVVSQLAFLPRMQKLLPEFKFSLWHLASNKFWSSRLEEDTVYAQVAIEDAEGSSFRIEKMGALAGMAFQNIIFTEFCDPGKKSTCSSNTAYEASSHATFEQEMAMQLSSQSDSLYNVLRRDGYLLTVNGEFRYRKSYSKTTPVMYPVIEKKTYIDLIAQHFQNSLLAPSAYLYPLTSHLKEESGLVSGATYDSSEDKPVFEEFINSDLILWSASSSDELDEDTQISSAKVKRTHKKITREIKKNVLQEQYNATKRIVRYSTLLCKCETCLTLQESRNEYQQLKPGQLRIGQPWNSPYSCKSKTLQSSLGNKPQWISLLEECDEEDEDGDDSDSSLDSSLCGKTSDSLVSKGLGNE